MGKCEKSVNAAMNIVFSTIDSLNYCSVPNSFLVTVHFLSVIIQSWIAKQWLHLIPNKITLKGWDC